MSLKRKEFQTQQQQQGLRVAAGEPHLVSLGGGRLSTAVTIHHLPIGDLTIGSSPACGVVLNGTGVLPVHCTLYRSETDEILLVPEPEGRTLVDGNRVMEEVNLRQGAMLTIGKANYMRFNNPAEAEMIRSTMGSNDRISMPQLDFTSNDSSPTAEDDENRNILNNKFVESQASKSRVSELLEKFTRNEFGGNLKTNGTCGTNGAGHKEAVNGKFSNYTKNLNQNANNYANGGHGGCGVPAAKLGHSTHDNGGGRVADILATLNSLNGANNNNNSNGGYHQQQQHIKVQNSYDRYPKRGGGLQVFPMNGLNEQMNNNRDPPFPSPAETQRQKAHADRLREQEVSMAEQDRLEEILQMCAEYERQNSSSSNMTASPIVQNRIKTNGSLPRDKKSPFGSEMNSPMYNECKNGQVFFPSDIHHNGNGHVNSGAGDKTPKSTGYENVALVASMRRAEISSRYENVSEVVGDTHEYPLTPKKYVPQSPRTKIRTNCQASPKPTQRSVELERKVEYDLLMKSFEDRQAIEDQQKYSEAEKRILSSLRGQNNNSSSSVEKADGRSLSALKKSRNEVLRRVRELKTTIADLQRQEDEVQRELDMEKALVSGELISEKDSLFQMETELNAVQQKISRLEAQRRANRVMQETQQKKLQQTIEIKENEVSGLEKLFEENPGDVSLREQLDDTIGSMENDKKMFEDLEFQYLEEETDWLSQREELHNEVKQLTVAIEEKRAEIMSLENQKVKNQDMACTDTKVLEKSLFNLFRDLERGREELKNIDKRIFQQSGHSSNGGGKSNEISDSEDDDLIRPNEGHNLMSNSLFGSEEILKKKPSESLMSKSMNENMFFNNLETPDFSSTPKKGNPNRVIVDISEDITNMLEKNHERLKLAEADEFVITRATENVDDPLLKLKYNVSSSPALEKSQSMADVTSPSGSKINLNLSLEADDFEVNPMIERVPSQDDIDRISKVTSNAPISTQGASYKVKESIKEIERNRQLLLTQQGSHVIEHERQKMNELKKKSHDEARAQYLRLQSSSRSDSESSQKNEAVLEGEPPLMVSEKETQKVDEKSNESNNQRHSHPDFGDASGQPFQHNLRPLSEAGSDSQHFENGSSPNVVHARNSSEKQFKSTNDIFVSTGSPSVAVQEVYRSSGGLNNGLSSNNPDLLQDSNHRNSGISTHSGDSAVSNVNSSGRANTDSLSRLVSGARRNLPKVQRPLTRYLPIMSADLDLRQHIETAGHQINLCPHVTVDSTSCRGYLHKLGATFHGWSRRWFVLDRQKGALIYYSDKSERKPRGGAYFTTIDEVYLDHLNTSKSGRPHCTFIVKTKKRSYHLQAASDAAARIWIDAIITGAQGNMDYL